MKKKVIGVLLVLVLALGVGCFVFISDYYHADEEALAVLGSVETDEVIVSQKDGMAVFLPRGGSDTGLIFYPGGKVEYSAYAPLLYRCAEMGITCVLVEMPGVALNMQANLENSAVATGLEKVSFHSDPKERQCQRMLKVPHNCTHLTREGNGNPLQCSCLENPRDIGPGRRLSMGSHRVGHD